MDKNKLLSAGLIAGGALIAKKQFDDGNVTGRELVYHNTNKKNIDSIKNKGILKTRSYDKDNITHKGLKGSVKVKNMGGLTYVGRSKIPALGVGFQAALHDSKNPESKNHNKLLKSISDRTTLKAKIPSWKMEKTTNPELLGTKNGREYRDVVLYRKEKKTGKKPNLTDKVYAGVSANIMHTSLGPKKTHTLKESIKPQYIKGSDKYRRADKEEVLEYIRNNPVRFASGVGGLTLGGGMIMAGIKKIAKDDYIEMIKKEASVNVPLSLLGAGLIASSGDRILGKKQMYHGTSKKSWKGIRDNGLQSSAGGKGVSSINEDLKNNSQRQVYLTSARPVAVYHAAIGSRPEKFTTTNERLKINKYLKRTKDKYGDVSNMPARVSKRYNELDRRQKDLFMDGRKEYFRGHFLDQGDNARILNVKLDYNKFKNNMVIDNDLPLNKDVKRMFPSGKISDAIQKNLAAKGPIDVPIENIRNAESTRRERIKHTLDELPSYIKENPVRFGTGFASAAGGAYLLKKGLIR